MGTIKSERGKRMGCKIARLKLWGAKSHNWQNIGGKSAIKPLLNCESLVISARLNFSMMTN